MVTLFPETGPGLPGPPARGGLMLISHGAERVEMLEERRKQCTLELELHGRGGKLRTPNICGARPDARHLSSLFSRRVVLLDPLPNALTE